MLYGCRVVHCGSLGSKVAAHVCGAFGGHRRCAVRIMADEHSQMTALWRTTDSHRFRLHSFEVRVSIPGLTLGTPLTNSIPRSSKREGLLNFRLAF